ncbi:MAG: LutC/YkgG family protein [Gammaproteobacteria bacterium WSBS_2016_MAG_OTU1]
MTNNTANDFKDDRDIILNALDSPPLASSLPTSPSSLPSPPPTTTVQAVINESQKQNEKVTQDELIQQFVAAAKQNSATVEILTDEHALPAAVANYMNLHQITSAVCTKEWKDLNWAAANIVVESRLVQGDDVCGIGGIIAAAADSGAMLTDNTEAHRITASLLPPYHIAIVRASTIRPSLKDVLEIYATTRPNKIALLCGPSRTADIEQTLILGVHGPLAVHVLVV